MEIVVFGIFGIMAVGLIGAICYELLWKPSETESTGIENKNIIWTKILRIISMINLICGIIIGIYLWWYIADEMYNGLLGFGVGTIVVLLTMISTSAIMVFVEMSENTAKNRENTDKILKILSNKK